MRYGIVRVSVKAAGYLLLWLPDVSPLTPIVRPFPGCKFE